MSDEQKNQLNEEPKIPVVADLGEDLPGLAVTKEDKEELAADAATVEVKSRPVTPKGKKKKQHRVVTHGHVYVQASYNNTIVTFTDQNGNVLSWSSAGVVGFHGPKKSTPYAASIIVKDAADKAATYGLKEVSVFVSGIGSGRDSAIRAINANGIQVASIVDITPIPHNGCRQPGRRRM